MYYNKYHKTWKQAFAEVNAQALKHEIIKAIASEIVQRPVENLIGFTVNKETKFGVTIIILSH